MRDISPRYTGLSLSAHPWTDKHKGDGGARQQDPEKSPKDQEVQESVSL